MSFDFKGVADAFIGYYYEAFTTDRTKLAAVYTEESMLTFDGTQLQGPSQIGEQLLKLPWKSVSNELDTVDAQPSGVSTGVLVMVTGLFKIDGGKESARYAHTFHLLPTGDNNYYVHNEIFRINP